MAANAAPKSGLFDDLEPAGVSAATAGYSAKDIEVLEGLEPVRKRPAHYIRRAPDARAMHHVVCRSGSTHSHGEAVAGSRPTRH